MTDKNQQLKDIIIFAQQSCIDIFNDYTWKEVKKDYPPSVQKAWEAGKALVNIK